MRRRADLRSSSLFALIARRYLSPAAHVVSRGCEAADDTVIVTPVIHASVCEPAGSNDPAGRADARRSKIPMGGIR